jgi:uncharacterized protein (TIGR02145 family)
MVNYGQERSFSTASAPITVTDIDGNVYNVVDIGGQIWIAENLKVTKYNDGTAIPYVVGNSDWSNLTSGAWSYYDHDENNNGVYGKLYNGYAVNTGKLCPTGWHVPSGTEWTTLIDYLGGESVAGGKLKDLGTTYWSYPNTGATNETGFTALPGGIRFQTGDFSSLRYTGLWWNTPAYPNLFMGYRFISNERGRIYEDSYYMTNGLSIRCIKD